MIIVRIVQFVKIVQLVQLDYYGYIKFFGVFVGTWVGAFTLKLLSAYFYHQFFIFDHNYSEYISKAEDNYYLTPQILANSS